MEKVEIMKELISVIIPVYKTEEYLERCVASVLAQSYNNLEIILIDDGSPDRCGELCDLISERDSRIRVIHKENGGLSSARNVGLSVAKGDYFTLLDSDDCIHPEMLKLMAKQIQLSNSDMVATGLERFQTDIPTINTDLIKTEFEILEKEEFIEHLYPENFGKISVTACGKLYRTAIFGNLRYPEGVIHEDLRVYLEVLQRCKRISVSKQSLYYYYVNPNSIMMGKYLTYDRFGEFSVRETYIDFFAQKGFKEQALLATNDYLTFFMRNYFAVKLRYSERKEALIPHIKIFKKHIKMIMKNPFVCRMRKVCVVIMLIFPRFTYRIVQKFIPDCLIEEMR